MGQLVTLGGRTFKVIDFERRTVLQDHYLMRHMRLIGADSVMPMDGETNEVYFVRIHTFILDSGKAPALIAGYLLPEEKTETDFTPGMAAEIAAHIGKCCTPADRELVISLAGEVAFAFFKLGLDLWARSQSFLGSAPTTTTTNQNQSPHESVH